MRGRKKKTNFHRISSFLVHLVDCHDQWHFGCACVVDGLRCLLHDTFICCNHQHHDVRQRRPSFSHACVGDGRTPPPSSSSILDHLLELGTERDRRGREQPAKALWPGVSMKVIFWPDLNVTVVQLNISYMLDTSNHPAPMVAERRCVILPSSTRATVVSRRASSREVLP